MKQETKAKLKKALKWTGFAVLCAFACFGAVVACASIARNANGAEAQNTAEQSATQRADLAPRRALNPSDFPTLGDGVGNLLADADFSGHYIIAIDPDANQYVLQARPTYDMFGIGYPSGGLAEGYYQITLTGDSESVQHCRWLLMTSNGYANFTDSSVGYVDFGADVKGYRSKDSVFKYTFVVDGATSSSNGDLYNNLVICVYHGVDAKLSLVNAVDVPASDVLTLPSDWSPSAWVSNRSIGGYPMLATTYTTSGNAGNSSLHVGWNNVLFRTANDGRVFTRLRVRYRWMWNGAKFKTRQGQYATYDWDTGVADNYLLFPYSVEYFDGMANQWFQVAEQDYEWGNNAEAIITDRMKWINERYRTLYFVEFPESPQFLTISEYTTDLWVTTNPLPIVMRYGLTFGDWFGLGSGWASPTITDVGTGDAIGVIRSAFSGLLPILNIAILPNITLGLLLFLPMIGGIIILIIKAVNK